MASTIYLPAVALVLAMAFTSGGALKCFECKSVGSADDTCTGEMLKNTGKEPTECNLDTMKAWYNDVHQHPTLTSISGVFEVFAGTHNFDPHTPMSCVKMTLRVDNQPATLRTCQTAKTAEVDPCKALRQKISRVHPDRTTVEYCGMCETDECNGSYALSPTMMMAIVPLVCSILMSLGYSSA